MLKKELFTVIICVAIVCLLAGCTGSKNVPIHSPSPTDTSTSIKTVDVTATDQYSDPQLVYGSFATNGKALQPPTYLFPAFYTADQYIKKAFDSSYLLSGQLVADGYSNQWAENNVYGFFSVDYANQFTKLAKSSLNQQNLTLYKNIIYTPDSKYQIINNCTVKNPLDACRFPSFAVTNASFVYNNANNVKLDITILVYPIYQKPNTFEGNSVVETRKYDLHFSLTFANPPVSVFTKKPIMVITGLTSSLEIQGVKNHIINETQ